MGVASHLNIRLDEYDARIRTFIPGYEQMLDAAAGALRAIAAEAPVVVDLGTGTGALAARCVSVRSDAKLIAIDEDPAILDIARQRLASAGTVASYVQASFLDATLPRCHAIVASLALHHVRTVERKRQLYRACGNALERGGLLITADCCVSSDEHLAQLERKAWQAHLRRTYTEAETYQYFSAWAVEDVYFPLAQELAMLRDGGLVPDVVWRAAPFAVIAARKAP